GALERLRRIDRRGRTAAAAERRDGRERTALWRTLSAGRGLFRGAGDHAGSERRGARLRPAGHAGDGRAADRRRGVGAGAVERCFILFLAERLAQLEPKARSGARVAGGQRSVPTASPLRLDDGLSEGLSPISLPPPP